MLIFGGMIRKALFLDRDGVINHDPGDYTCSLAEFHILPTVIPALKKARDKGYDIVVVTNQGGIAKGLYTHETVAEIHAYFKAECAKAGVSITEIYYSPHHPDYSNSLARKPHSLWVERAIGRFGFSKEKSLMIGDRDRDVLCAEGAGVRGIKMVVNGDLLEIVEQLD